MRLTLKTVNKAIAAEGLGVMLVKGEGYFYWLDANNEALINAESVMVYALNHVDLAFWLREAREAATHLETN
jgi:hypothetical protein